MLIFWGVVALRFLVPLFIPRYPLPAIIAAMLIDGIDQTIFQKYTTLNLDGYQGYDKALDIYYLTIAYISTMRNWTNLYAYKVSAFLFYYRMIGDLLFQLTQIRAVLLIFPNTFEYFFDFYEAVRLKWKPIRMAPKLILGAAAFIWIFIKLPQEYWIHVAQLDTTDFIKENILHVSTDTSWSVAISQNLWIFPVLGIIALIIGVLIYKIIKILPKADHKITFEAIPEVKPLVLAKDKINSYKELINRELFEKIVMMALIIVIFAQVIPGIKATNIQLVIGVSVILFINTFLTFYLKKIIKFKFNMFTDFILMIFLNVGLALIYTAFLHYDKGEANMSALLFFSLMVALLVTLYDTYNPYYQARRLKATK